MFLVITAIIYEKKLYFCNQINLQHNYILTTQL